MNIKLPGVLGVEKSANKKLSTDGMFSSTWVTQESCPKTCLFLYNGCYAKFGNSRFVTNRVNQSPIKNPIAIAHTEAMVIEELSGQYPLRLHVVGDCAYTDCAKIVAKSAAIYQNKNNQPVFTYTHSRSILRAAWGIISVLKSCHTLKAVRTAYKQGYAAALVVRKFKSDKAYPIGEFKGIPCPYQTHKVDSCKNCRLCFNADKLRENKRIILFSLHGTVAKSRAEILTER